MYEMENVWWGTGVINKKDMLAELEIIGHIYDCKAVYVKMQSPLSAL